MDEDLKEILLLSKHNNDYDDLLLRLNHFYENDSIVELTNKQFVDLIEIYCSSTNKYINYVTRKILIKYYQYEQTDSILQSSILQSSILQSEIHWQCPCQKIKFLFHFYDDDFPDDLNVYRMTIDLMISLFNDTNISCDRHCLCYVYKLANKISKYLIKQDRLDYFNTSFDDLIESLLKLDHKKYITSRCTLLEFFKFHLKVLQTNKTMTVLKIFECPKKYIDLFSSFIFGKTIGFAGQISWIEDEQDKTKLQYDKVIVSRIIMIYLKLISSIQIDTPCEQILFVLKFDQHLNETSRSYFKNKQTTYWLIDLFINEDDKLLSALICIIRIKMMQSNVDDFEKYNIYKIDDYVKEFIKAISLDSRVLLDMLCNDSKTATKLLQFLLLYLKLDNIKEQIDEDVRNVFIELGNKLRRLSEKKLFPYKIEPLIKLLHKLK